MDGLQTVIKFEVKAKKTWTLLERHLVADAIDFALQHYGIPSQDINLRVRMCGINKGNYGLTVAFGTRFIIKLHRAHKTLEELLRVVFHEITHLKQGYEDELDMHYCEERGVVVYWNHYTFDENALEKDYYNTPWEIEAIEAEDTLLDLYLKEVRNV